MAHLPKRLGWESGGALPNFVLTRVRRVPNTHKSLEETMESKNRQVINKIYNSWWADPNTVQIHLIERKMDSTELIRSNSRVDA